MEKATATKRICIYYTIWINSVHTHARAQFIEIQHAYSTYPTVTTATTKTTNDNEISIHILLHNFFSYFSQQVSSSKKAEMYPSFMEINDSQALHK